MALYTQPAPARSRLGATFASAAARAEYATKADPVGNLIVSSYGLSQPVRLPRRFDTLAQEGYNSQAPVYRAINLIATGCAGIPWRLYQRRSGAKDRTPERHDRGYRTALSRKYANRRGVEIDEHPLLSLMQSPNPNQGWGKLFEAYVSYVYIAGNSYLWANKTRNGKGEPVELWTLRPDRMRITPDAKQFVAGYTYEVNGAHTDFDVQSILHTKTFAPLDDWYGMSPLVVAARNIDMRNAGGDWNLALLQNMGRVPGFFTVKERLADTQFDRMREQLIDRYSGRRNVGLPGLLDGGDISWLPAGTTPLDMDWSQLTQREARDIAITLGVPAEMIGDPEVKTYASYSEARASLYTETILPDMDIFRDEFNRWLVPMFGSNLWLDYDTEEIEALAPLRAQRWSQVNAANFLTINEKREATGYDAVPEGDVIVLLTTNTTLDEVAAGATSPASGAGAQSGQGNTTTLNVSKPGSKPQNDGSETDEGAPTPAPDADSAASGSGSAAAAPGGSGAADGGTGSAVDGGSKRRAASSTSSAAVVHKRTQAQQAARRDPLDDLLAGRVLRFPSGDERADRGSAPAQRRA